MVPCGPRLPPKTQRCDGEWDLIPEMVAGTSDRAMGMVSVYLICLVPTDC